MLTDTEGIVLRQVKTSYNRRMILLFTKKYGKISAGTSLGDRGRSRSSLALRPFTCGRYEIFANRNSYNINRADAVRSYYAIGEDIDKYMNGAYVLEFTEKVLEEGVPAPGIFDLLIEFFDILQNRKKGIGTLVLAYQTKLMRQAGVMPELDRCTVCGRARTAGERDGDPCFSIDRGGFVCGGCAGRLMEAEGENSNRGALIYRDKFGIIDVLKYFVENPLKKLENIALDEEIEEEMQHIIRRYAAYYLDISNIKSEEFV